VARGEPRVPSGGREPRCDAFQLGSDEPTLSGSEGLERRRPEFALSIKEKISQTRPHDALIRVKRTRNSLPREGVHQRSLVGEQDAPTQGYR
jgi:hypothetical protein